MHCPACQHPFSFFYSFRIVDPLKHSCPSCKTLLTIGAQAITILIMSAIIGFTIAGVALYMRSNRFWDMHDSLLWFAVALPAFILPHQWLFWRQVRFSRRH